MRLLVIFGLVASSIASSPPRGGYSAPTSGGSYTGVGTGVGTGVVGGGCGPGQVQQIGGGCVQPQITRNFYLYSAPRLPVHTRPRPQVPRPRVEYNIVFVRTPEGPQGQGPIVVPPPQQKTLVYVLTRGGAAGGQNVIEVPAGPDQAPEVFYVNYNEGDNPQLVGGIDLQSALASASAQQGQLIQGTSGTTGGGGSYGRPSGVSFGGPTGGRPTQSYNPPPSPTYRAP